MANVTALAQAVPIPCPSAAGMKPGMIEVIPNIMVCMAAWCRVIQ